MRRCVRQGCGVVLLDTDETCPVCGGETVNAGTPKIEKQPHYNEPRVAFRHKRASWLTVLLGFIVAAIILYMFYTRILETAGDAQKGDTSGAKLIDMLSTGPQKK
jgi:rRNA maturation protein Nop10